MGRYLTAIAVAGVFAAQPVPLSAADVSEGRKLANAWCASCHLTSTSGTDTAPRFSEIAKSRALNAKTLAGTLADPHPAMPRLDLTDAQIEDIVAYIRSLNPELGNGN